MALKNKKYPDFRNYFNNTYFFRNGNGKYTNNDWILKAYSPDLMKPTNKQYHNWQYGTGERKRRTKTISTEWARKVLNGK